MPDRDAAPLNAAEGDVDGAEADAEFEFELADTGAELETVEPKPAVDEPDLAPLVSGKPDERMRVKVAELFE